MKVADIHKAQELLNRITLTKADKEVRKAILKNFASFSKVIRDFNDTIDTLRKKMFGERQEEVQQVSELRQRFQDQKTTQEEREKIVKDMESHKEFFEAESEFYTLVHEEEEKDVECDVVKVDIDRFIDCLVDTETTFKASDLSGLEFMFN